MTTPDAKAKVILLSGPSGAGKTRLANRLSRAHGWPIVRLDDFYKDADDPSLPTSTLGIPDWDELGSWNRDAAVTALVELCRAGMTLVPIYDLAQSRQVGSHLIELGDAERVIAEGIFAASVIRALDAQGLLAHAICVRQSPRLTFARRLARDLAERRKPPTVLVRRGWQLMRGESTIVAAHVSLGATAMTPKEAEQAVVAPD